MNTGVATEDTVDVAQAVGVTTCGPIRWCFSLRNSRRALRVNNLCMSYMSSLLPLPTNNPQINKSEPTGIVQPALETIYLKALSH